MKPFWANAIVFFLELLIVIIYLAIGYTALIDSAQNFDFSGMFRGVRNAIWFINIASLCLSLLIWLYKPLRTPQNKKIAISNTGWVLFNIYAMYF